MPADSAPQPATARNPGRYSGLDGLRGLAILLVFLFHYGGGLRSANPLVRAFGYLTQAGWVGVELFFALSGFLITRELCASLRQPHALRNFYARRALRILPLYFGALVLAAVAALLAGASSHELRPLLLYAAFLQNIPGLVSMALRYPPPLPLHHLWSLAVEEQFYLLWPFLLLLARSRREAVLLCLWLFTLGCLFRNSGWLWPAFRSSHGPFHSSLGAEWSAFLPSRGGALALGGALAFLPGSQKLRAKRHALVALGIGLLTFLGAGYFGGSLLLNSPQVFLLGLPGVELASAALVALALAPGTVSTALSLRPLCLLGRISYGFYVFHVLLEPVFDGIGAWATHTHAGSAYQLVRLLAAFLITFALAWLSYRFFEQQFFRLKRFFPRPPLSSR